MTTTTLPATTTAPANTTASSSPDDADCCATRHPIVLVHGLGSRDDRKLRYWGRIPQELTQRGARLYCGQQEGWATIEHNGHILKENVEAICTQVGCEKVNIIAHSKGGLDARYAITMLGLSEHVASLTTIATPHRGSHAMDYVNRLPHMTIAAAAVMVNGVFRVLGDKNPDFSTVCRELSATYMHEFNRTTVDHEEVYYQSYIGLMDGARSKEAIAVPYLIIKKLEGDNDGLVSLYSARWGTFRKVFRSSGKRGVSHADEIDMRRKPFARRSDAPATDTENSGPSVDTDRSNDIVHEYVCIVAELKAMGF